MAQDVRPQAVHKGFGEDLAPLKLPAPQYENFDFECGARRQIGPAGAMRIIPLFRLASQQPTSEANARSAKDGKYGACRGNQAIYEE